MLNKQRYLRVRTRIADVLHELDREKDPDKPTRDAITALELAAITLVKAQTGPAPADAILAGVRAEKSKQGGKGGDQA